MNCQCKTGKTRENNQNKANFQKTYPQIAHDNKTKTQVLNLCFLNVICRTTPHGILLHVALFLAASWRPYHPANPRASDLNSLS